MVRVRGGRYELLEVIGSGGMGTVWRARDRQLDRTVALKSSHPLPPGDPRRDRLAREARLAAAVSHANLVEVFDVGQDDEGTFLVMEFVDAPSLHDVGAGLGPEQVLTVGAQVAEALAAIHRSGVVHRDLKPSNVLLPPAGAKLVDFGIALAVDGQTGFDPTTSGVVFGTAGYTAPEVAKGQPATARSDVYGLGVVIGELLQMPPASPVAAVLGACTADDPAERPEAAAVAGVLAQAGQATTVFAPNSANGSTGTATVTGSSGSTGVTGLPASDATTMAPPGLLAPSPGPSRLGPVLVVGGVLAVVGLVVVLLALGARGSGDDEAASALTTSVPSSPSVTSAPTTTPATPTTTPTTEPQPTTPNTSLAVDPRTLIPQLPINDPGAVEDAVAEVLGLVIGAGSEEQDQTVEQIAEDLALASEALAEGDQAEAVESFREAMRHAVTDLEGAARRRTVAILEVWADQLDLDLPRGG